MKSVEQFSQPIAKFQVTQWKIAEMTIKIETARLLVHKAAWQSKTNPTSLD